MRRIATLLSAAAVAGGVLVSVSAQPAYALAQCTTVTHRHYHAADGYYHTWYWQSTERLSNGQKRYWAWMPEHGERDSATC